MEAAGFGAGGVNLKGQRVRNHFCLTCAKFIRRSSRRLATSRMMKNFERIAPEAHYSDTTHIISCDFLGPRCDQRELKFILSGSITVER
jgi:hypothetical protein